MHRTVEESLEHAIRKALPLLQSEIGSCLEEVRSVKRLSKGSWQQDTDWQPSPQKAMEQLREELGSLCGDVKNVLLEHYPEYKQQVGVPGGAHSQILFLNDSFPLNAVLLNFWKIQGGSFDYDDGSIRGAIGDFARFIDRDFECLRYWTVLIHFDMSVPELRLPSDVVIRHMSVEELSLVYSAPFVRRERHRPSDSQLHPCVMEITKRAPKVFGGPIGKNELRQQQEVLETFERAICCLRAFQPGAVGFETLNNEAVDWSLLHFGATHCGNRLPTPIWGSQYELDADGVGELTSFANRVSSSSDKVFDIALRRLADAEIRNRSQDRVMDAVIGLEALLLPGVDRELSYQFALRYASLFSTLTSRHDAFRRAKEMYAARSKVAHGSDFARLHDVAKDAVRSLRGCVHFFRDEISEAPYRESSYWHERILGMTSQSGESLPAESHSEESARPR